MRQARGQVLPRLLGLVLIGTGLAVLLLGGYLVWNSLQARLAMEAAAAGAEQQVEQVEQQLDSIRGAIRSEAFTEIVGAENESTDRDGLVAALRSQGVGNVLNIAIAREAIEQVDLSAFPGQGFAALEMLLTARRNGSAPAQVHFPGTPDEYLALSEALDPDDPAGAVALVTFPLSVLVNRMDRPDAVEAMRLVQVVDGDPATLEEFGGAFGTPNALLPVGGSMFGLAWYRSSVIGPMSTLQLAGVAGVGLLLALLGLSITRRSAPVPAVSGAKVSASKSKAKARPGVADNASGAAGAGPSETASGDAQESRNQACWNKGRWNEKSPASAEKKPVKADKDLEAEDDEFLFDPDAPADDPSGMRDMLRSLLDEDADEAPASQQTEPAESGAEQAGSESIEPPVVPPASIFRAYDIRGIVGKTLSTQIAEAIGLSIGSEARSRGLNRIAVARDGRLSGAELLAALTRGLMATGVDVIDVGAVPTPVLYYAAQELGGGSGVMVTGSHNPPDYNGFKIVLGGETLHGDQITALHTRLAEGQLESGAGSLSQQQVTVKYIERIATDIQLEKPLKVVADCGNGIAGAVAPRLLEAIGAEVIPLYAEVDGTFPNHHPDPGDPTTLEDLRLCVRNFNADVGVAFDGDGDRLGVVAPDGEIIYPDRLMMLFARDVLSRNPDQPIVFDVKCSRLLAGEIERAGGKPVMGRTGHSYLKAQLKREGGPLAGEMSGHFFFAERWFGFDDGMYAAARLLEILAADTRAPAQILATLPKGESTPELKVQMKEGEPHAFVEEFARSVDFTDARIIDIDGVRADFEDGFGLVRASNTTPVLVLRFEGDDIEALERIQELFRKAMLKVNPTLKLPF